MWKVTWSKAILCNTVTISSLPFTSFQIRQYMTLLQGSLLFFFSYCPLFLLHTNYKTLRVGILSKIFVAYFGRKVYTFQKNNLSHQNFHIPLFGGCILQPFWSHSGCPQFIWETVKQVNKIKNSGYSLISWIIIMAPQDSDPCYFCGMALLRSLNQWYYAKDTKLKGLTLGQVSRNTWIIRIASGSMVD